MNEVITRTILRQSASVAKVLDAARIMAMRQVLDKVVVADPIRDYATRLVLATHPDSEYATERVKRYVKWGARPRAAQALIRGGRVRALSEGRAHVAIDDLRYFAGESLGHRVLLNYDGQADNVNVLELVAELVAQTAEMA